MALNEDAAIEITAFKLVPEFAQGVVRDLRVRWALEEAGLDYRARLLDQERPADYLLEQPFDQVPCFNDGKVRVMTRSRERLKQLRVTQHPRIEIAARSTGGAFVVAGVHVVRPALERLDSQPFLLERGDQTGSDRGLADVGGRTGNYDAGDFTGMFHAASINSVDV